MLSVIIRNGRIVDGSGNPWYRADIGIKDGVIVCIRRHIDGEAQVTIDAKDMVVAPGFIDVHTHSDYTAITHSKAHSSVYQGVTTEATGQCGGTVFPLSEQARQGMRAQIAAFSLKTTEDVDEVCWSDLAGWRKAVSERGVSINLAPYLGHGTIRTHVMGEEGQGGEKVEPTEEQMRKMLDEVRKAMEDGAFGMSTGLRYVPGRNAKTKEVIEFAKVVAEYDGVYISHMRSEEEVLVSAVKELIQISKQANILASSTHHKAMFPENWGKVHETLRLMDAAREQGIEVMCDFYPWEYAREANLSSYFYPVMPKDLATTDVVKIVEATKREKTWADIKAALYKGYEEEVIRNDTRRRELRESGVMVADIWNPETFDYVVHSRTHPEIVYKNFREIADMYGKKDYWEVMRQVFIDDEGETYVAAGGMSAEDIITVLKHPLSAVSTDSWILEDFPTMMHPGMVPHPRNYGTFPLILHKYVRELKVLSLPEAVRKMSSLPAQFLGLRDRGLIRESMKADIVVFDPDGVKNNATFKNPCSHPDGIPYVLVNGVLTVFDGRHTGALAGQVLKR